MTDFPYSRRMLNNHDWARLVSPAQSDQNTGYTYDDIDRMTYRLLSARC
jgi:hypothetical protein